MTLPSSTPGSYEELLSRMVACNTVNPRFGGPKGGEMLLAAEIEGWARKWGLGCRRFPAGATEANLLVFLEAGPAAPWLLFDSHLDTVGVEGMAIAPFQLLQKDGRLWGRGACDSKASGAAMLSALRAHAQTAERKNSIGVLFTVDEEFHMVGARAFAAGPLAEFRSRLRGIVVGEPTALRPVVATNGVVRWRTITRGLAAHSSDPSRGRSAISAMVRVIDALEQHYVPTVSRVHPLTGRAAASINVIAGGTAVNVIPDYCEILCDRRLVPGEDANDVLAQRDAVLRELPAAEHDSVYVVPPLSETATADLYRWARPALIAAGGDPQPSGAAYVTNGSIYAAAGAPVLVLGPRPSPRSNWLRPPSKRPTEAIGAGTYAGRMDCQRTAILGREDLSIPHGHRLISGQGRTARFTVPLAHASGRAAVVGEVAIAVRDQA